MPALPPDLYGEIVQFLSPHFRTAGDRDAILLVPLSTWSGFVDIIWDGSERAFTARLVHLLPEEQLVVVLNSVLVGHVGEQQIANLCAQVKATTSLTETEASEPIQGYYQTLANVLSGPRYQLDSRFVQLTLLIDHGVDAQGMRFTPDEKRNKFDSLNTLLAEVDEQALVLLGDPGSGKTTLLRRLQLEYAWQALKEEGETEALIPFFVPLNSYRRAQGADAPPPPMAWLNEAWHIRYPDLPTFSSLFEQGKIMLLLDGLNEMPSKNKADYRERVDHWQRFLVETAHYGNRVLFSCRSLDYSASLSSEGMPVKQVKVEGLNADQIETFIQQHLPEQGATVWQRLQQDKRQMALFASPFFLRLLVEQVDSSGEIPTGQAALMTGFIRRALYREVERRNPLFMPDSLLSDDDCQQIQQAQWASLYALPPDGALITQLSTLAYRMQDNEGANESGQVRVLEKEAHTYLDTRWAEDIIKAGIQLNILDKELATREISFTHQLLQEYFAARVVAENPELQLVAVPWRADEMDRSLAEVIESLEVSDPLPAAPTTGWEETMLLAVAMSRNQTQFVTDLMAVNLPLAARCMTSSEVYLSPQFKGEMQQALLARIEDKDTDLRARIATARALGRLGDPRFVHRVGKYGDYYLPPMVTIEGGIYPIGSETGQEWEKPIHEIKIDTFEIGIFPVTNAAYALFIEAGGYEDEQWWKTVVAKKWLHGEGVFEVQLSSYLSLAEKLRTSSDDEIQANTDSTSEQIEFYLWIKQASLDEIKEKIQQWYPSGKKPYQPRYWENNIYNHKSQPVVGISWFEANAYCAWLSAQTGQNYKLPSEVEWEATAGGKIGREFVYGKLFDPFCCNTYETHIRCTTPIGIFPNNCTPEGIRDLTGNVWEWTTTIWGKDSRKTDYPYPYDANDGREDLEDGQSRRILRGGSWYNLQNLAYCSSRIKRHPTARVNLNGFRVVRYPLSRAH